jgi:poly(A)-specific ribonuclease
VGHNCLFDVSYGLYGFADSYLPSTWRDFKKMARSWHPGGIWDTKYISRQLPEVRRQAELAACRSAKYN